ncbi:hypothetical protein CASFOL_039052 [Castilleja foliolosa]|uniref:rRNA N-glycosylase n=1 Tax=Castilleja foliolosa TaxID=1961234 RepID=A0ABD3BGV9_9LAMI
MTKDSKKNSKKNADSEGQEVSDREASSEKTTKYPKKNADTKKKAERKVKKSSDKQAKAKDEESSEKQASDKEASSEKTTKYPKKNADTKKAERKVKKSSDKEASSEKTTKYPKKNSDSKKKAERKVKKPSDKQAKAKDEESSDKQASKKQASEKEASSGDGDGDDLKLFQDKSSTEYITFIHNLRERLRETAFGDIFVLPRAAEPLEYATVQVVIDEVKKIKVKIRRDNVYAVAFSICGGSDIEGVWFWFDDHSRSRDDETLGMEGNYMIGVADWKNSNGLGNVKIGRDDIGAAYYRLRDYLTEKQRGTKMKKRVIKHAARAILTIIIVVCEAARFDDIKETVVNKYESDYGMLEGLEEEKRVEKRIKNWSTNAKRLDKDIRLFQFADWMMIPQATKSRLEAAKEGVEVAIPAKEVVEVAIPAKEGVEAAIPAKEGVEVAIPDSLRLKGYECVEVLADGKRYAMRKICPDGNCQFRSLSHQLDENEEKYKEVREKVFNQLKKDPGRYKEFYATEGREKKKTYDDYVQEMSMNYCWGDDISLSAAADAYNSRVVLMVWNASEKKWDKNVRDPKGEIIEREIYLRFRGKHYDSITPVDFQDEEHE